MDNAGAWEQLDPPLQEEVLAAVKQKLGFTYMTPVQQASIPCLLQGKDVSVQAETGSGKTLAFLLPILHMLYQEEEEEEEEEGIFALLISPTRELATQTHATLEQLGMSKCPSLLLIGGRPVLQDLQLYRQHKPRVVIATPGRLLDFISRVEASHWKRCRMVVLDEADRLLDMGFTATLDAVLAVLPGSRITALFSATQTSQVAQLARAGLKNALRITVKVEGGEEDEVLPVGLRNWYEEVPLTHKLQWLASQIYHIVVERGEKVIVFCLTCATVNYLYQAFEMLPSLKDKAYVASLHGKIPAKRRPAILQQFTDAVGGGALLTTDVAARGLDVPGLQWVIQWDAPQDSDQFNHRVGRTARAGAAGDALIALTPEETAYVAFLEERGIKTKRKPAIEQIPEAPQMTQMFRERAARDREFWKRGQLAYLSYVRGYREHQVNWIFQKLDYGNLATCFGLATLPSMPELKGATTLSNWTPVPNLHPKDIPFVDAKREAQRQANAKKESHKRKLKEEQKKQRLARKKKSLKGVGSATQQHSFARSELVELAQEAKLLKLLKKRKITEEEFERRVALIEQEAVEQEVEKEVRKKRRKKKRNKKTK